MAASQARKLTTSGRDRGRPLADFLAERLGVERSAAAALVRAGGVYIGRARVEEPERTLDAGQRIAVHGASPRTAAQGASQPIAAQGASQRTAAQGASQPIAVPPAPDPRGDEATWSIAREDTDILVVAKPAGMPSQAGRDTTVGALDRMVEAAHPGARLLHRLDRDASGLVLFTRHAEAHRRFAAYLGDGRLERRYAAVARGHLPAATTRFDQPIGPDPADRRRMAAGHGRPALTHVRAARRGRAPTGEPTTLLEIDLATGRTHQIRVHLAAAGHPLRGDPIYGDPADTAGRLCLHACRLAWPGADPVTWEPPPLFATLVGDEPRSGND